MNDKMEASIFQICCLREKYQLTWMETADIINEILDMNFDESYYRKHYKRNLGGCFNDYDVQLLADAESAMLRKQKERMKAMTLRGFDRAAVRTVSRRELLFESVKEAIQCLPVPEIESHSWFKNSEREYVLCIADLQGGANFDIDGNRYSIDEMRRRFEILQSNLHRYIIDNQITHLHIVELGDTLQGILRCSDLQLNETSVVEALVRTSQMIAVFLNNVSSFCRVDYYHVPSSNHTQTRPLGTKASELSAEDLEYVIGHYIADMTSSNHYINVHLNDGEDYIGIPIFDFNIIAMHGHTIKNLDNALPALSSKHRKLLDYIFVGHYHTNKSMSGNAHESHDTEVLVCPSFQGTDPYAYNRLGYSSKAACKMYSFDQTYGLVGTEKFILN